MRRATALATSAGVALAIAASCAIGGFDRVDSIAEPASGPTGAGAGSSGPSGSGAGGCAHVTWPAPPADPDPGPDAVDFVAAVRRVDMGETDLSDGPLVGYDLDNLCTCRGDGPSCEEPPYATADHCDGPGGRDNAVAQLFKYASTFDPDFSSQSLTDDASAGRWTLLLRMRDYNGAANDDRVTLAIYASPGLEADPCWPVDRLPSWDGTDPWPIDALTVETGSGSGGAGGSCSGAAGYDPNQPIYFDAQAYVTEFVVVANLPQAGLVFSTDGSVTTIKLVAGFLTARLEEQSSGWAMRDGLLTGRWRLSDFFETLRTFTSGGDPICTDSGVYPLIKNAVCSFPDIASELGGASAPCDAMSFGMAFEADPALLGIVVEVPPDVVPSCPAETDPANDSCESG